MKNDFNEMISNLKAYVGRLTQESAKQYMDLLSEYVDLYLHNEVFQKQADMTISKRGNPLSMWMQAQGFKEVTIMPLFSLKKRSERKEG